MCLGLNYCNKKTIRIRGTQQVKLGLLNLRREITGLVWLRLELCSAGDEANERRVQLAFSSACFAWIQRAKLVSGEQFGRYIARMAWRRILSCIFGFWRKDALLTVNTTAAEDSFGCDLDFDRRPWSR